MRTCLSVAFIAGALFTPSAPAFAQFVQQGPKLVGTGAVGAAGQGTAVAISADGNTAIVGGQMDDGRAGAAWVFTRSNGVWTQQGAKLVGTGAIPCCIGKGNQGSAVAISADGNTAVVGGWSDNNGAGAAWIFVRSGGVWTQQGSKLVGTGPSGSASNQGWSVALSADGNTALVGGMNDGFGVTGAMGATWVFVRTGSTWTQQGSKLVGTGATEPARQGASVALSADGNTALIGGPADNGAIGAGWVFVRSGSTWTQQGERITPADAARFPNFGSAVALSGDGNTAAIGGPFDGTGPFGAVWVFTRSGSTWTQQGSKLVGTGTVNTLVYQGSSVSLSGDGTVLVEGGPRDDSYKGAAWVFVRTGTTWTQMGNKLFGAGSVGDGPGGAEQGVAVAVSSDGLTAMVGGWNDNAQAGAAWIFTDVGSDLRRAGDHDGDRRSEITTYNITSGVWSSLTSSSGFADTTSRGWGGTGYEPAPGDYDGDGKTDLGLYVSSTGYWYVLLSGSNFTSVLSRSAGGPGWQPVPRDFDGDGKTDFVVYNTTTGQWWGLTSSTNYTPSLNMGWGGSDYLPIPADYDGDGKADVAVYNVNTFVWSVVLSSTGNTRVLEKSVGSIGWTPVPADYDGDGKADFVAYRADLGWWFGLKSENNYTTLVNVHWGGSDYQPVKGDYDGDGRADFATYVSSTGMWYILLSGANYTTAMMRAAGGPGYAAIPPFP
jgi:hypothetical protein